MNSITNINLGFLEVKFYHIYNYCCPYSLFYDGSVRIQIFDLFSNFKYLYDFFSIKTYLE